MTIMEIMTEMGKIGAIEKAEMGKRVFVFVKDAKKAKELITALMPYKVRSVMGGAIYSVKGKVVELYYE